MVCCTVVQYTCLLINDAHHKYLQATLNLDSCLEIHCMPNPFGEKIKKDHYSNIIKLVSNILLEIAECDYIIQTSDHLVRKALFTPSTCHLFISMTFAGQFLR